MKNKILQGACIPNFESISQLTMFDYQRVSSRPGWHSGEDVRYIFSKVFIPLFQVWCMRYRPVNVDVTMEMSTVLLMGERTKFRLGHVPCRELLNSLADGSVQYCNPQISRDWENVMWVNYNDLTVTSLGIMVYFREIIPFHGFNLGQWNMKIYPEWWFEWEESMRLSNRKIICNWWFPCALVPFTHLNM